MPLVLSRRTLLHLSAPIFLGCAAASSQPGGDLGGKLERYVEDVERFNREGRLKRIAGVCASACTIYLGVKNVCVDPSAELWFHAASRPRDNLPDPAGSLRMLAYYPPPIRRWAMSSGALEQTTWSVRHMLTSVELIRMGMRPCPPRDRTPPQPRR